MAGRTLILYGSLYKGGTLRAYGALGYDGTL